ncbi:MAG: dihydroorotate dehydrogenase electron transfer subunit [Peptostreptococcaceae bacterium]|nr:dihydroorotate dehydrogenase electron transfer subunit [Peptostreptococcaceae bacterium]
MFQIKKAKIIENCAITHDLYLMKIEGRYEIRAGQFFMLKAIDADMTLYRPISIFDADEESVSFLYSVRGKGTAIFSRLRAGDEILLHGAYGNGFPKASGKPALVGGGIGMAPLLYTAKQNEGSVVYIGVRDGLYSEDELARIRKLFEGTDLVLKVGGIITDAVEFERFDEIFTCGPEVMMAAVSKKHQRVFVSMEKHMGCGVGACLSCSCKVDGKMKKVCQDGPVFLGQEVF